MTSKTIKNTRATFIIDKELLSKLKKKAYWDRLKIKDVLNSALENYLK